MAGAVSLTQFTDQADAFLAKYVSGGNVAYKKVQQDPAMINNLYTLIGEVDLSAASDNEKKAFYINAYNLIVIQQITAYYPMKSALDKNGFFDRQKHKVAGEMLTLDQIEKGKVILKYRDPRVHFAFSCAARGCPPLANFAYRPERIDDQLERATGHSLKDFRFIRFDLDNRTVLLSKIFDWYERDFTAEGLTVVEYINQYRDKEIPRGFKIEYYAYDWSLNELTAP